MDLETWDLDQKEADTTGLAFILHRLIGRMIATLTLFD
jgi:hypothetical protein